MRLGLIDKYVHVLIRSGMLRKGWPSSLGDVSQAFVLTEEARNLLKERRPPGH